MTPPRCALRDRNVFPRARPALRQSRFGSTNLILAASSKKRGRGNSLALCGSELRRPLVSTAATSRGTARHKVACLLAPGNWDANKLLHERDRHGDASAVFLLEHDSAFVGLQYAAPVE